MRIGFVVSYLELTGGHIAVVEIANRLAARGHDVLLVYPQRSIASRRNDALRRLGRVVPDAVLAPFYVRNGAELDWASFAGDVVGITELEDRFMPRLDVVVATAWQTAERVAEFALPARKVYFIQHYETWSGPAARVDATWRGPFLRIATSEWLADLGQRRFGLDDIAVVPYGVDLDAFYPDPPKTRGEELRVGMLLHAEPWKGNSDGFAALRSVIADGRGVEPVLFGMFEPREELPAGSEVHLHPSRSGLRELYSSLDVFLCPSWTESGPMTVSEAMACEVCVVSTDVGNVSLWTQRGEAAFLAPARNPAELARVLTAALDDPHERARKARRGRELIQAFTWDRAAEAFAALVERTS